MRHIPGDVAKLRHTAGQIALFGSRAAATRAAVSAVAGNLHQCGTNEVATSLGQVLRKHDEELATVVDASNRVSAALNSLANQLELIDDRAAHAVAMAAAQAPSAPPLFVTAPELDPSALEPFRNQALITRAATANLIDGLLPNGEARPLVERSRSTLELIWENSAIDILDGLRSAGGGIWDWSLGFLFTAESSAAARAGHATMMSALRMAIVDDKYPDGRTGARAVVLEELGDGVTRRDLLDQDPAAWFAVAGIDLALLLLGGGALTKGSALADKLGITAGSIRVADMIPGSALSSAQIAKLSPTMRTLYEYPKLYGATQTALSRIDGIWDLKVSGLEGRGRRVEDLVFEAIQTTHPGMMQLAYNHKTIDIAADFSQRHIISVKSIDTQANTYVDSPSQLASKIRGYAYELEGWKQPILRDPVTGEVGRWGPKAAAQLQRDLYVGIPSDGLSQEHAAALEKLLGEFASPRSVDGILQPRVNIQFVEVAR